MGYRLTTMLTVVALGVIVAGCTTLASTPNASSKPVPDDAAVATFAGGCFWCTEAAFQELHGVYEVISGYTGGTEVDPTYQQVASGQTGHAEAVEIHYDPEQVGYDELLDLYWRLIDPTDADGQFVDRGSQYRTAIFFHDDEQRALAEASRDALVESGRFDRPIVTPIEEAMAFYPAEEYHQDFYLKAPERYEPYKQGSGRDPYFERVWGDEASETETPSE